MTSRACAVLSMAVFGLSTPVFACPGVVPCVPSYCFDMHRGPLVARVQYPGPQLNTFPAQNITFQSQVPLAQMGGGQGSSLYGWVDPLNNREYAIMGRTNGTAVIDITNPTQPAYVAEIPKQSGSNNTSWREPKVYGNHAYIGVDGTSHRLQVVDLTQVRNYSGTTMTLNAGSYTGQSGTLSITRVHTLDINKDTGFLYLSGTRPETSPSSQTPAVGLHIVDVRNPGNPTFAGFYNGDDYTHETQVVTYRGPDSRFFGHEIAFNSNGKTGSRVDTVSVVDVTNKSNIVPLATKTYTGARYIHQGWLTEDHKYFFQNDELDETGGVTGGRTRTHLWDMRDLTNPVYKGHWDNTTSSVDHNLYVKDGYVYQTNYTTGLRILKIGNLESNNPSDWLEEVAFFDTYLPSDSSSFNGAWNNYPFFPSGNVAISDIQGGLFIVRPDLPNLFPPFENGAKPIRWEDIIGNTVPEPGTAGLIIGAMVAMGARRRR